MRLLQCSIAKLFCCCCSRTKKISRDGNIFAASCRVTRKQNFKCEYLLHIQTSSDERPQQDETIEWRRCIKGFERWAHCVAWSFKIIFILILSFSSEFIIPARIMFMELNVSTLKLMLVTCRAKLEQKEAFAQLPPKKVFIKSLSVTY